jgi:HAD superfamily hydrolase (TIGR01450 family)
MLNRSTISEPDRSQCLQDIKCWLLDMDGTVSMGEDLIPGTAQFFDALAPDRKFIFLTNNPSHSAAHYVQRMNRIGIPTKRENVLTSTDALILYLKDYFKKPEGVFSSPEESGKRQPITVFPVGTPDFESELTQAGIRIAKKRDEAVDAVLLAFDTTLTYEKCDIACDYIRKNVPYFATNPDRVCPLADGKVLPDCGALIAFMETCTEKKPVKVIGKPDVAMIRMVQSAYGYQPDEMAMAGDRIYTDLVFAKNAGILCVAVLTGEASLKEIEESRIEPDFVFDRIGDIAEYLTGDTI